MQLGALGQYSHGSWALSSYTLYSTTALTATQSLSSNGTSSASGPLGNTNSLLLGNSNSSFSRSNINQMSWSTFQSQSSKLQEKGTYAAGSYSLSLVSLTSSGTNSFTYNQSGLGTYTTYTTTSGGLVTTLVAVAAVRRRRSPPRKGTSSLPGEMATIPLTARAITSKAYWR